MTLLVCPTCLRSWAPIGEEPAVCPACRHGIGLSALVGGRPREEAERRPEARLAPPAPLEDTAK